MGKKIRFENHHTGLRYYQNEEMVVFTALKVASRYCDEYFYKNDLDLAKEIIFDKGTKNFQPTNLEVTKININNTADNVIPAKAEATFNIRFNNKHSSTSIKRKLNKIFVKINKKCYFFVL